MKQLRFQYNNLDTITTRASKLLGDCKAGNIEKELKKLKAVDTKPLENKIADLTVEMAMRNDKIEDLKKQVKSLERIKEAVGALGDVFNKARLFDEDIKTKGEVCAAKIIKVLVSFTRKMETALVDIRKIVSRASSGESSRPSRPPPTETPQKKKPLSEVKTPLPQQPENEVIAETSGITPPAKLVTVKPAVVSVVTPTLKGKKSVSVEPSLWKGKKESSPEYKELAETLEEMASSSGKTGSEQVIPPPKKKKGVSMRSSDRKRPPFEFKTPAASKKHQKSLEKGGSSQKKPQGK